MYNYNSSPTLTNVTIIGNQARTAGGGKGGGMYNASNSSLTLAHVTISGNQAGDSGGGVYNDESSMTIRNSIIWGNSATNIYRQNIDLAPYWSTSLSISDSLVEDADPRFIDPKPGSSAPTTSGDYRLQKDSPAINAGNNSDIPNGVITDLDGKMRVAGASVDMGAYEFQPPAAPPTNLGGTAGDGKVDLTWNAATDADSYTVYKYAGETSPADAGDWTEVAASVTGVTYTVTGLTNGTNYAFSVKAVNLGGASDFSGEAIAKPQTVPAAPTGVGASEENGQAAVSFTVPTNDGGSPITDYTATAWVDGAATNRTATGAKSPITVTGLTYGTAYTFTVHATNAAGDSPESGPPAPATPLPPAPDPEPAAPTGPGGPGSDDFVGPVISTNGSITIPVGSSGEVNQDGAIFIIIPVGAADREQRITIEKVQNTQDLLPDGETPVSDIYELLKNFPEAFNKPVTLTLVFDPSVVQSNQTIAIFYYDETEKKWIKIGGEVRGNNISAEVDHFTKFAVFAADEAATAPDRDETAFSDIPEHWAEDSIKQAVLDGIIAGYPDGTFKPDEPVTRAEFTVMLAHALKLDGTGATLPFTDRAEIGAWAEEAVARAVLAGIVNGYEDGRFQPNKPITRTEMAAMIAKALQLPTGAASQTGFSDDDRIPGWAKSAVEALGRLGIVSGRSDGKFVPNGTATRAETVVTLLRMLKSSGQN